MNRDHLKAKFTEEINTNLHLLNKICRVYGADPEDRRDLFQEIVSQLWKTYPSFSGKSRFSTWLYRVALNTALHHLRRSRRQKLSEEEMGELYRSFQGDNSLVRDIDLLYRAVNGLSKIDRALVLLYLERKTYRESAEILGISEANVSVRLVRAKKKLTGIFESLREC